MLSLKRTISFTSLLTLGCSADVGNTDGYMGAEPGGAAPGGGMAGGAGTDPVTSGATSPSATNPPGNPSPVPTGSNPTGQPTAPVAGPASSCVQGVPPTSQIQRLTNAEYDRTVYDLLGVEGTGLLAAEQDGPINKTIWDGYVLAAETIARRVMADANLKANFLQCTPEGDGTECLRQTITNFGKRAYRRPLTAAEVASFEERILARRAEVTEANTPEQVAELLLSTFLQSPAFLQRAELGQDTDASGRFVLTDYEVASRLSYLLWGSMPDQALFDAADRGELRTKQQVLAQAQRMVSDDKARFVAREFHDKYVHLTDSQHADRWAATMKDASLFPAFVPQVTGDMIVETQMFFDDVFTSGGSFQDLLLSRTGFVTSRTAAIYRADGSFGDTPTKTELDASRPGFLTRIGFLAAFSNQERTNPIVRGSFVTKDVLGVDPGIPVAAAANTPLPTDPNLDTLRKRVESMTSASGCAQCHEPFINPPGFVLEAFDSSGAARTLDTTIVPAGVPLDTSANVYLSRTGDPVAVNTPSEMMTAIANAPSAQRTYVAKWVGFAFDRILTGPDQCAVDELSAKIAVGGYSIKDLLIDLTQQDYFMARVVEVTQ